MGTSAVPPPLWYNVSSLPHQCLLSIGLGRNPYRCHQAGWRDQPLAHPVILVKCKSLMTLGHLFLPLTLPQWRSWAIDFHPSGSPLSCCGPQLRAFLAKSSSGLCPGAAVHHCYLLESKSLIPGCFQTALLGGPSPFHSIVLPFWGPVKSLASTLRIVVLLSLRAIMFFFSRRSSCCPGAGWNLL